MCKNFKRMRIILTICFFWAFSFTTYAAYLKNFPVTIEQSDGTVVHCFTTGDEFYGWLHDSLGYTLIQDPQTGFVVYATSQNDELVSTGYRFGSINPASVGLQPWIISSSEKREKLRNDFINITLPHNASNNMPMRAGSGALNTTGTINNIVIFIDFVNDTFPSPTATKTIYMERFDNYHTNNPLNNPSMRHYFHEVSYQTLNIVSNRQYSYRSPQRREYYLSNGQYGYNPNNQNNLSNTNNRAGREHQLLTAALNSVNAGSFDHVCFVIKGSVDPDPTNRIFWAHKWNIIGRNYNLIPEAQLDVGIMAHEMCHSLGAADYYDTNNGGIYVGTGNWDLMATGYAPPAHPNPRVKIQFGWAVATPLNAPQFVTVPPSINNRTAFYRINTTTFGEYFIIENRQNIPNKIFDKGLPGYGLLIYRCRSDIANYETANQINITHPQRFYPVAANAVADPMQVGGYYGTINSASCAWPGIGKTQFTDNTTPSMKSWAGGNTEKPITDISDVNRIVTFKFMAGTDTVINAYASAGGTIFPSGAINVTNGNNYTFTFTPNEGEVIEEVLVDSVNVPSAVAAGSYTFTNVTESHNIYVRFSNNAICPAQPAPVTASVTNDTDCMLLNQCAENQSESNSPWTVWATYRYPAGSQLTGSGMFSFDSRAYPAGSSAQLIMPEIITNSDNYTASFWMYRDNAGTYGGQNYQDKVNVYFSTTPSKTGLTPVYTVHRCRNLAPVESVDGWYYYSVSIPTIYINSGYVIFEAVGDNGNYICVDEFYIDETVPTLKVKPTILNFSAAAVGTASTPKVVTVSGIMTGNFTYTKTGTNANDFTITETFWNANRGGILSVTFTPSGVGTRTAEIIISSDNGLTQTVTLNGIGLSDSPFYCAGTGTATNPYQICNANQLAAFAAHINAGNATSGKYYILANDIDLNGYSAGLGWQPIGNLNSDFQGNFNGNGKVIRNLTINRPTENFVGLFSFSNGATIQNLGIENANVKGKNYVGSLVGDAYGGSTINNCYAIGSVSGNEDYVGGLVGYNYNSSTITNSYASCNVSGGYAVGGLVGYNVTNSTIANCYATGSISGSNYYVGGLVGYNSNSTIRNCIAANNSVIGQALLNRITGYNYNGTFSNNYALSTMVVKNSNGNISITDGLNTNAGMGKDMAILMSLAFYNTAGNWYNNIVWSINPPSGIWSICENKWLPFLRWQGIDCNSIYNIIANASVGGTITPSGTTIVNSGKNKTFTFAANSGYVIDSLLVDGINIPDSIAVGRYTFTNVIGNHSIEVSFKLDGFCGGNGTLANPYQICNAEQLAFLASYVNAGNGDNTVGKYYILADDIDLDGYAAGTGWKPIGDNSTYNNRTRFQGYFNGNGKVIQNLIINRPTENYIGLFGYTSGTIIQNLGIKNCNIEGNSIVGSLVGYNTTNSQINSCYATGIVSGNEDYVGGLIGYNYNNSIISNCYASCNVSGNYFVGGLIGYNVTNSIISNCYAIGSVSGNEDVGGLVGSTNNSTIQNCIAANETIVASTQWLNRIVGYGYGTNTYQNNYALNTMTVQYNGINLTITDGSNLSGTGKDMVTLMNLTFYNTAGNWYNNIAWSINPPSGIWSICDNKSLPFLRWQGVDCNSIYNIIANTNAGGTITPNGTTIVNLGENKKFTFTAHNMFEVDQLLIDGVNIPDSIEGGSYTFVNITDNHTIEVTFKLKPLDFCGGDGSIGTPYEICTAEQLKTLADYTNLGFGDSTSDVHYVLMNNIDLSGYSDGAGWKPIGDYNSQNSATSFQGNFNGNNKVIQNLTINRQSEGDIGLFGFIFNAKIENIGIENCNIVGYRDVGGLVGFSQNSIISGCYVKGNIKGSYYNVGGLVGANYGAGSISNCYTTGRVNGFGQLGGLVGYNGNNISNCYTTSSVSGTNQFIGGVSGVAGTIRNCVAANDTVITSSNTTYINRITGSSYGGSNNYALNTMIVKNSSGNTTITDGLNTAGGMSKDMNTLKSFVFYATANNWYNNIAYSISPPSGIWKICDSESLPFLRWQRFSCGNNFTIIATAGINGSISPSGMVSVVDENNQTFTFAANNCYKIDSLWIDNVYVPDSVAVGSYTFNNITENHTITVSFKSINFTAISNTTCSGVPYYFGEQTLTVTGVYYDTLQTIHSCDSIIELTLTVNPVYSTPATASICQGETYPFFEQTLTAIGEYEKVLQTVNGCDSVITLVLDVLPTFTSEKYDTIFDNETYNEQTYQVGNYTLIDTLTAENNCDSIVITYLHVEEGTGFDLIKAGNISIFPNPTKDELFIVSESKIEKVEIYTLTGSLVAAENNFIEKISTKNFAEGVYLVKIYTNKGVVIKRVIKN